MRVFPLFSEEDADLRALVWIDNGGYGQRSIRISGRVTVVKAHRVVLSRVLGRPLRSREYADHIFGDLLDCRRDKLRLVTPRQNAQNRPNARWSRGTFLRASGRWAAMVCHSGRLLHLGCHDTREEAANVAHLKRLELGFLGEDNFAHKLKSA